MQVTPPRLVVLTGPLCGRTFVADRPLILGRAAPCDVVLPDESCSRRHASVEPSGDGRLRIRDLGSTNGTYLNGERVEEAVAGDGDEILLGGTTLAVRTETLDPTRTVILPPRRSDRESPPPHASLLDEVLARLERPHPGRTDRVDLAAALVRASHRILDVERCSVLVLDERGGIEGAQVVGAPDVRSVHDAPSLAEACRADGPLFERDETALGPIRHGFLCAVRGQGGPSLLWFADRSGRPFAGRERESVRRAAEGLGPVLALVERLDRAERSLREHRREARARMRIVGESEAHRRTVDWIRRNAPHDQPVLLLGEPGTGKELFAHLLHEISARRAGPFVRVRCAALPGPALEAALFGDDSGEPGLLEAAREGTVFLDAVDALDLATQARLAEQTRPGADPRIVASTERDLGEAARGGDFRPELLARLARFSVRVPPLRERAEDVPLLADHFLRELSIEMNRPARRLSPEAMERLRAHDWPGNVRELRNCIERAVLLCDREVVETSDLLLPDSPPASDLSLAAAEKAAIERALRHFGGRKGRAAQALGISWPTLNKKIRRYGIEEG